MKKKGVIKILTFLSNTYRNFKFPKDSDDATSDMIDDWSEFIQKYKYDNAREGVKNWAKENPSWAPNAPQLMHQAKDIERRKEREEHAEKAKERIEEDAPDVEEPVDSMKDARKTMEGSL